MPLITRLQDILEEAKKRDLIHEDVVTKQELLLTISTALDITKTTAKKYIDELEMRMVIVESSGMMYRFDEEKVNNIVSKEVNNNGKTE